jgi:hypothetical protein
VGGVGVGWGRWLAKECETSDLALLPRRHALSAYRFCRYHRSGRTHRIWLTVCWNN